MRTRTTSSTRWLTAGTLCLLLGALALSVPSAEAAKKKKKKTAKAQSGQTVAAESEAVKKANRYLLAYSTEKARKTLEAELAEESAPVVTAMGRVLTQEGQYDQAIAELERASGMAKSDPDPKLYLGEALLAASRDGEASSAFRDAAKRAEKLLENDPENGRAHYQLGVAQQRLKNYDAALASLAEAGRLDPGNALIPYQIGLTRAFRQEWQPAFDRLSEAIDMNGGIAYAYYYRALSADKVGRGDLLVNDLHRFLELAPDAPDADRARRILAAATG